jgi:hypothetical protein
MTAFPALVPSSRTFTSGEYPATAFSGYSGTQNRVRHSHVFLSAQLRLSFQGLSEEEMLDIWQHYSTMQGSYSTFELPTELLSGSSISNYVPDGYRWRYTGDGSVEDLPCGGHNVSLTLETVPPIDASVAGVRLRMVLTLTAGQTGIVAPGISETITMSLVAGEAGIVAPGISKIITLSLTAGEADNGITPSADYWSDWVAQNYGWESLFFIDWWGN